MNETFLVCTYYSKNFTQIYRPQKLSDANSSIQKSNIHTRFYAYTNFARKLWLQNGIIVSIDNEYKM